jgi:hypothetical protein
MTKEAIAIEALALPVDELVWLAVEIGNKYHETKPLNEQWELSAKLDVEGFSTLNFCGKKKAPSPHL